LPEGNGETFKTVGLDLADIVDRIFIARHERADADILGGIAHRMMGNKTD
jgi:hypothetical protein